MKAWPAILAERYPLRPDQHPVRPWWLVRLGDGVWRRDGTACGRVNADGSGWMDGIDPPCQRRDVADFLATMAEYDAATPLPFPGIRVGQTWAANVTATDASVFTITEYDSEQLTAWRPGGGDRRSPWFAGGSWIDSTELVDFCRGGFLLADTVCPWLAPWAGVE